VHEDDDGRALDAAAVDLHILPGRLVRIPAHLRGASQGEVPTVTRREWDFWGGGGGEDVRLG
jgi:hypothetical protein